MCIVFKPDQILELAEHIERNGARFYHQASQGAEEGEMREFLQSLAVMEDEHEKFFAKMRANLKKEEIDFEADEQASSFLKVWAEGHIFDIKSDPVARMKELKNIKGILNFAIGLEKESIVLYLGMKNGVNNKNYRDGIEEIIKAEMSHIVSLNAKLVKTSIMP